MDLSINNGVNPNQTKSCVILINYNGAEDTRACLASLQDSTVPIRIGVVDNTPDDSELSGILELYPDVKLIRSPENLGFGRGNNLGLRWAVEHTGCEFFFLLNNDAVVYPDSIRNLEDAMARHPDVGIMVPRIAYLDRPDTLWYGGGEIDWRRGSARTPGINRASDASMAMIERDVTFATGCAMFVRRSVFVDIGGFDPRFFMYEEDVEFCLRALEHSIRVRYIPQVLILHKCQGSSRDSETPLEDFWSVKNRKLPFYAFHVVRNRLLNMSMHAHGLHLWIFALFFPLYIVRRAVPFLIGGRVDAIKAMFQGGVSYWRDRHERYNDELLDTSVETKPGAP